MALSSPRGMFGVHSVCFFSLTTGMPLAYLRVIGECNVDFTAETADLEGGSQQYPWDSAVTKISSEISLVGREYDGDTMALLMGGTLTENAAEATGATDGLANVNGTSVVKASTGIETVAVTSGDHADLKEGKYMLKYSAAKKLKLYALSDVDFQHGTDLVFANDDLYIEELDFSGGVTAISASTGLTFTCGSGTISFTDGDTGEFYVRKPNSSSIELVFGQSGAEFTKVGVLIAGQKQADGSIAYLELYNCMAAGMPIGFAEKKWAEWSVKIKALYSSSKNAIGKYCRTISNGV